MKVVPYEEFVREDTERAVEAQKKADGNGQAFFDGAKWCRDNLGQYVMELTTCRDCVFSHRLHGSLFCRQLRRSYNPETEVLVREDDFCSFAMRKEG